MARSYNKKREGTNRHRAASKDLCRQCGGGENLLHIPLMLLQRQAGNYDVVQVNKHHGELASTLSISRWKVLPAFLRPKFSRRHTVILFSSRYLFPAKSICPTFKQAIQIFMQIRAAAPPSRKLHHIFV
jgi:hypothetical protein